MTKKELWTIIETMGVEYPRLINEGGKERLELWYGVLKNFDKEIVAVAARQVLIDCKFEPKIGDITEQIKKMHRALFVGAEEVWHKYEEWLDGDYKIKEQRVLKEECGSVYCMHYSKGCDRQDKACARMYETVEAHFDTARYQSEFGKLPGIIRDYFFGSIESAKKLGKASDTTMEVTKNRFIKFYDNALLKVELQNSVSQTVIEKIQKKQDMQLVKVCKSVNEIQDVDNTELEWYQK